MYGEALEMVHGASGYQESVPRGVVKGIFSYSKQLTTEASSECKTSGRSDIGDEWEKAQWLAEFERRSDVIIRSIFQRTPTR